MYSEVNYEADEGLCNTWLSMEHVIGFHSCNLGHGGEDMGAVYSSPLQTVAMVDLPLSCLLVYVKLHEIGNKIRLNGQTIVSWMQSLQTLLN